MEQLVGKDVFGRKHRKKKADAEELKKKFSIITSEVRN